MVLGRLLFFSTYGGTFKNINCSWLQELYTPFPSTILITRSFKNVRSSFGTPWSEEGFVFTCHLPLFSSNTRLEFFHLYDRSSGRRPEMLPALLWFTGKHTAGDYLAQNANSAKAENVWFRLFKTFHDYKQILLRITLHRLFCKLVPNSSN